MNHEKEKCLVGGLADSSKGDGNALKWFVRSAAMILIVTGFAKVWSAFGNVKVLAMADPIIGIQTKHLMLAVGAAEIIIALICLFGKRQKLALALVAWLATNFMVYRIGLGWINWKKPCSCLGNLTDALHISPETADMAMKVVLGYLLIGSCASLFWLWKKRIRSDGTVPPQQAVSV